jgi:hypothetical protein
MPETARHGKAEEMDRDGMLLADFGGERLWLVA